MSRNSASSSSHDDNTPNVITVTVGNTEALEMGEASIRTPSPGLMSELQLQFQPFVGVTDAAHQEKQQQQQQTLQMNPVMNQKLATSQPQLMQHQELLVLQRQQQQEQQQQQQDFPSYDPSQGRPTSHTFQEQQFQQFCGGIDAAQLVKPNIPPSALNPRQQVAMMEPQVLVQGVKSPPPSATSNLPHTVRSPQANPSPRTNVAPTPSPPHSSHDSGLETEMILDSHGGPSPAPLSSAVDLTDSVVGVTGHEYEMAPLTPQDQLLKFLETL